MFGKGYQEGRQRYFREPAFLDDHELVDHLETAFWWSCHEQKNEAGLSTLALEIVPLLREGREKFLHYEIGKHIGMISGCLIPRQPYEDEMIDVQYKQEASPTPKTPVKISHPMFRKGYQEGRQRYFQEQYMLSDDALLFCFEAAFEPSRYENEEREEHEDAVYYEIGQLIGEMCGYVIPRQLHEKRKQKLQKEFLYKIEQEHIIRGGYALTRVIQQFWIVQDQLAHTLDVDLFEEMVKCGRDLENPLSVVEA
jgi:hypothetical protein